MSQLIGGIGIAHTPSMGYQYDKGMSSGWEDSWKIWYDGTQALRDWLQQKAPTHLIVIYNDHMNYFDLSTYPTFAIGMANHFPQADEGYGLRPFPGIDGDAEFAWPVARSLIEDGFDLTFCQELELDHGIYSWLPYLFEQPWPVRILPIAVNMLMHPLPTPKRLRQLGEALRHALDNDGNDARVVIIGTGGMSHQIHGTRFGMTNERFDRRFLDMIESQMDELIAIPVAKMMQVAGTEAIELTMWYAMRGALSAQATAAASFYTCPAVTGCGFVALDEVPA
jgi:protocatechuate 4,5-dioxygenase beta chain